MEQTINFNIDVPEGKKAVLQDNKIVFEDIKPKLPKTWEEFCKNYQNNKYFISDCSNIQTVPPGYLFNNKDDDKNLLPSEEDAKAHLALMQLHQLRDCYRQGWIPDWKDDNSVKYAIVYNYSGALLVEDYLVTPMFLSFQSEELAKEFIKNFLDLIEQAGDLI